METRLDLKNLNNSDSVLQVDPNGLLQLVVSEKIASLKPGEIAPPFNEEFENTARLQSIALGRRVITNRISLGSIAQQMGLQGALLVAANGTNQVIPPINGVGPSNFNIDATDFFQSMTLRDGWLVLKVENNFPIDLTNLQYSLQNVNAGNFILQNTIASLPSGAVHYDSVHLVNNFLIEGNLVASLVNLDSPGSNGNTVLVDTSDAINLEVSLDQLDPVSATAVFPAQNLFDETAEAFIYPPSALITSVHVSEGDIFMDAYSTINDSINLSYILPGAINQSGNILQFLRVIPATQNGQVVNEYVEIPVVDYNLDMQGMPGSTNVHNTFYTTFIGSIDSTGRIISLSLQDSVFVRTGIRNLVTDRGYGFMGYDTISGEERFEVDAFGDILGGTIDLDDAQIRLEIENYVGAPFDIRIQNLSSQSGNSNPRTLTWNQLGFDFTIPRAQEPSPGAVPSPGILSIDLDNTNSNIQELIEIRPDSMAVEIDAFMNAGTPANDFSQFLNTNYGLEAYVSATVPMKMQLTDLELGDSLEFNYQDLDPASRLRGGNFRLIAKNNYPFRIPVELFFIDEMGVVIDSTFSNSFVEAAPSDANGRATGVLESILDFPIDSDLVENLKQTKTIYIRAYLSTMPVGQSVELRSENYLDLQLVGDFTLSTQ